MQKKLLTLMAAWLAVSMTATWSAAEESSASGGGGTLKGRFVVSGTPGKLQPLNVNKDPFCINNPPSNDTVVVGKNNALVNAVVYLKVPIGGKIELPADNDARLKKEVVLDNKGCTFHPHVLAVQVGQKFVIKNSDPVGHNTNLHWLNFNPIVPANGQADIKVNAASTVPTPVECNIHTWMKAHVVPLTHPYVGISGPDGTFEIKNIPAGQHEFQFWHEAQGYMKNLRFTGGSTDPRVGRAKLTIADGKTLDLGDIKVPVSALVPR